MGAWQKFVAHNKNTVTHNLQTGPRNFKQEPLLFPVILPASDGFSLISGAHTIIIKSRFTRLMGDNGVNREEREPSRVRGVGIHVHTRNKMSTQGVWIEYGTTKTVADLGGRTRRPPSPVRPNIFSISCSFSQNLAKSYVGAPLEDWRPLLRGILDPPLKEHVVSTWDYLLLNSLSEHL